jgi:hypothetical protein
MVRQEIPCADRWDGLAINGKAQEMAHNSYCHHNNLLENTANVVLHVDMQNNQVLITHAFYMSVTTQPKSVSCLTTPGVH